ncbi:Dimer_Tnp_hAT domain-containing protein [Quillaja saponaria]|uniref:Dimer_Tnp_hAT domain-containing protein n=1 Tax=Quillaja saponaria TaxID=32244 RepID=A0AAD7L3G5_QUISA|nr:Dimer_Tnp_hAT domain-containing protein [Quillaja saponaria]
MRSVKVTGFQGSTITNTGLAECLAARLIRLILTLHVSTATMERSFLAMSIIKTRLCSKMNDNILIDCLLLYI